MASRAERRLVADRRSGLDRRVVPERRGQIEQRASRVTTREHIRYPSDIARELTEALLSLDDCLAPIRQAEHLDEARRVRLLHDLEAVMAAIQRDVLSLNAI